MNERNLYQLNMRIASDRECVNEVLSENDLTMDENIDKVFGLFEGHDIVGTGSIYGNTIRSVAVKERYKGTGAINALMSGLISEQNSRGNSHLFLYSKYGSHRSFEKMGFFKVSEVEGEVVLMENTRNGVSRYTDALRKYRTDEPMVASVVVNCNPFTLGHQHLIERAASVNDHVHVFVVWEDKSAFGNEERYELVKEGTAHLNNVSVHIGKDYIISSATFPTYFIKESSQQVKVHAALDLNVFGEHIAPALGINRRYVGHEDYCEVTRTYNEQMKRILPTYGIEVIEIARRKESKESISASKVRQYLREEEWEKIRSIVPDSTFRYLLSKEAEPTINRIKAYSGRH